MTSFGDSGLLFANHFRSNHDFASID